MFVGYELPLFFVSAALCLVTLLLYCDATRGILVETRAADGCGTVNTFGGIFAGALCKRARYANAAFGDYGACGVVSRDGLWRSFVEYRPLSFAYQREPGITCFAGRRCLHILYLRCWCILYAALWRIAVIVLR